ncbi:MAG: STAS domain-containing protein [Gracilimonas sp.]|uniref:STAS domain-containing protein n=1 Tax=Gracilimonas sp. TaxID=1974203 RepID=UPI0019BB1720|nr:STAS domain-containing protein [Gracilimonas sp.]MBD3616893.1 STAS domain-containing protein [Gracilimonas sp.]
MKYDVSERYNCVIISLKGNVMGGPDAEKFRETLHKFIEEGKKEVIVDLGKVKFMNSSGLGILIGGYTTMKNAGGELVICQADQKIESLLMVTQLIKVFNHFRTLEDAVAHFENDK